MARPKRESVFRHDEVGIAHCIQRCVRRAYLAGQDPAAGKSFEHRREWIRRRLELLAAVFGIDVLSYAVMSNHLHAILRVRPDIVKLWSDEEVATRWLRLFPGKRLEDFLGEPTRQQIAKELGDAKRLLELRKRLSSISWFMRALSEPIARKANREDHCTGRFWEGRFKAQKIVDEAGLLACSMYVDLNPVRATMAQSPEQSRYTSAFDRIHAGKGAKRIAFALEYQPATIDEEVIQQQLQEALQSKDKKEVARLRKCLADLRLENENTKKGKSSKSSKLKPSEPKPVDAWLAPLQLHERGPSGPNPHHGGLRASDKGFLPMALAEYSTLLDWTGREGRHDKRGKIPENLQPILDRIGIEGTMWCDLVWRYSKYFGKSQAVGRPENMKAEASQRDIAWIRGQRSCQACFS